MREEELKKLKDAKEAILLTDRLIKEEQAKRIVKRLEDEDAKIKEQAYYMTIERRKKQEETRKLERQKFIKKALPYIISGVIGLGAITGVYKANKETIDRIIAIDYLESEIGLHGGEIDSDTGKHIHTIEEIEHHSESGHCKIKEGIC